MNGKADVGSQDRTDEVDKLKERLAYAEETLRAITQGEVDALVVNTSKGETIYTLEGEDKPYRILVEQMNEGAVVISGDGSILYSNKRFADLLKVPLERVMGQRFEEFILPLDRSKVRGLMREKGSELGVSQASLTTDDGTLVPVRISASKLRSTDGDTYSLIVSDMTAIVNAEQLLRQLNDELELKVAERTSSLERTNDLLKAEVIERVITQRQMLEEKETIALALNSIGDALIMTDGNDRIVLINGTGQKITGWRSPEALGKMSQEIFAIETEERVKGPVTIEVGVGDGECALCHQAILRTRNGGRVQVEYGACPLKAPDKREAGMILVFREVKGDKL